MLVERELITLIITLGIEQSQTGDGKVFTAVMDGHCDGHS